MSDETNLSKDMDPGQGLIGSGTPAMKKMMEFLVEYIVAHGCAPTYREIQEAMDYRNPSLVHRQLRDLEKRGYISKQPGRWRGIDITPKGLAFNGGNHGTETTKP